MATIEFTPEEIETVIVGLERIVQQVSNDHNWFLVNEPNRNLAARALRLGRTAKRLLKGLERVAPNAVGTPHGRFL
jgi:hypothetical protein